MTKDHSVQSICDHQFSSFKGIPDFKKSSDLTSHTHPLTANMRIVVFKVFEAFFYIICEFQFLLLIEFSLLVFSKANNCSISFKFGFGAIQRSEEHTSELQSRENL